MSYYSVVCSEIAKSIDEGINNLSLIEAKRESLSQDEIRVSIKSTSLNYFDLLTFVGKYQSQPSVPFSPCNEAAGIITEVGSGISNFKVGDRVCVSSATFSCCSSEIITQEQALFKIPETLSYEDAASVWIGFMTAYHGLVQRGNLLKGETVLVTGAAGGMGVYAIQLAKLLGATVIAAASSDEKLEFCKKLGADHTVNYSNLKEMKEKVSQITNGNFVDVIYEVVGGKVLSFVNYVRHNCILMQNLTTLIYFKKGDIFSECIRCIGSEGRLLVIGFAGGSIPKVPANLVLVKGFSLIGVRSGFSMIVLFFAFFLILNTVLMKQRNTLFYQHHSSEYRKNELNKFCKMHPSLKNEVQKAIDELIYSGKFDTSLEVSLTFFQKKKKCIGHRIPFENFQEGFKLLNERKVLGKCVINWDSVDQPKL